MPDEAEDLDALIRRVDNDRWLSTRFVADAERRADLIALQAFDHELSRALQVTSTPLLGEIRLTWWSEALDEIYGGGRVRQHPAAQALDRAVRRRDLPRAPLDAMIEARIARLYAQAGSVEVTDADDMSAAAYACAAVKILDPAADEAMLKAAAHAHLDPKAARKLSADAFPAVLPLAARGARNPLVKRLKLIWSVATGRL